MKTKKILSLILGTIMAVGVIGIIVKIQTGVASAQSCWGETCNRYYYPYNGWWQQNPQYRRCSNDSYTYCEDALFWWPDWYTSWRTNITDGSYVRRLRYFIPWYETNPTKGVVYGYYNTNSGRFNYTGTINHFTAYGYTFPVSCEGSVVISCKSNINVYWNNAHDRGILPDDCWSGNVGKRIYSDAMQVCNY